MCRILYTLEKGEIVSKQAAARWAKGKLGKPWADLIDRSLNWNLQDNKLMISSKQTLDFVNFTVKRPELKG